jgi:acetyltransferase-like isoleucine patch superfamily enzyme
VPNQALSDQRQAIWIGRQCFLMQNKIIIYANKMNALKTVLINPQIEISTFCDQPNVTSHFHQNQNKTFSSHLKTSP